MTANANSKHFFFFTDHTQRSPAESCKVGPALTSFSFENRTGSRSPPRFSATSVARESALSRQPLPKRRPPPPRCSMWAGRMRTREPVPPPPTSTAPEIDVPQQMVTTSTSATALTAIGAFAYDLGQATMHPPSHALCLSPSSCASWRIPPWVFIWRKYCTSA